MPLLVGSAHGFLFAYRQFRQRQQHKAIHRHCHRQHRSHCNSAKRLSTTSTVVYAAADVAVAVAVYDCSVLGVWKLFFFPLWLYVIVICNYLDIRIATCEQLTLYIDFLCWLLLFFFLAVRISHTWASLNGFENPSFGVSHTFHTLWLLCNAIFLLIPIIILKVLFFLCCA